MNDDDSDDNGDPIHPAGLPGSEHEAGSVYSPVTLVEYGDYECSRCMQAQLEVKHLLDAFGEQIRFVFRHFPDAEAHPHAELAAEAAEAAAAQGKFWEMHELLFRQSMHLSAAAIMRDAEAIELDMTRFRADLADHVYLQRVREHHKAGARLGLRGTPCFFLNDVPIDVSFSLENLEKAVRTALTEP
jgi:protein-disulfide isomerase